MTPERAFAERYAAERTAEINAEHAVWSTKPAAQRPKCLTTAELAAISTPPDPYAVGLASLKKEIGR